MSDQMKCELVFCDHIPSLEAADAGSRVQVITARPSILGLEVEGNLRKIVDYLKSRDHSQEDIIKYLKTSL